MRARGLLNLLLLLVVVGLAALAYLRPGLDEPLPATLSQALPEQVQRVKIERPGRETITFVRSESGWQLTAPISLPANPFRIEPLLQLRRAESHSSFPAVEGALSQYELSSPQIWLSLDGERYAFGAVEPLNGYRYVLLGQTVHLLSDRVQHYLLMSPYDFVALELLSPQSELVEVRFDHRVVSDELTLEAWGEAHARRVSRYEVPDSDGESLTLILSDGSALPLDILLREPEFILGVPERGVRYHFTEEEGEHLLAMIEGEDA
ncbi:MAG: DUF4340 domain-containing protein [Gammaproteobacteria bacterium]|nr:DUF4340 domain-containing protein [Gammaproteobacteria bacterium]